MCLFIIFLIVFLVLVDNRYPIKLYVSNEILGLGLGLGLCLGLSLQYRAKTFRLTQKIHFCVFYNGFMDFFDPKPFLLNFSVSKTVF